MKVGDLVRVSWDNSRVAPPEWGKEDHVGIYLGSSFPSSIRKKGGHYQLLSDGTTIEIPSWYWKLEVISESR